MHAYDISVRILLSALLLNYLEPDSCRHDESCILSSRHTHTHILRVSCSLAVYLCPPRPTCVFQFDIKPFRAFAHITFLFMQSAGVRWCVRLYGRLCGSACICARVCACACVFVWSKWEAYFTPFAAAHQNKQKKMRVSVLLCLGSATPQLGLL